jgi:hypothetical protein
MPGTIPGRIGKPFDCRHELRRYAEQYKKLNRALDEFVEEGEDSFVAVDANFGLHALSELTDFGGGAAVRRDG